MKRRKVWLGLGAAVMVTSAAAETPAADPAPAAPPHLAQGGAGHGAPAARQGGEGDEGGAAAYDAGLPPAVRFYRDIALTRGHLLVGDELVRLGRWEEALAHFLHPSEELYGKVRGDLKTYGVAPFAAALKALAQTVKARNEGAYRPALLALRERLEGADRGVRATQENWPAFVVETVLEMLHTATTEYEASIEGDRFAKPVEYQDSRGFVWEAERLLDTVQAGLEARDAEAARAARAALAELKRAWPEPVPPARPVRDVGQVLSDASRLELQLGRLR